MQNWRLHSQRDSPQSVFKQYRAACSTEGDRGEKESVDSFAQSLRVLFKKAYPNTQRGSPEAESMGKAVLSSQFAAGLLPEIKAKVAVNEGDLKALLAKAIFEEAKLWDLRCTASGSPVSADA